VEVTQRPRDFIPAFTPEYDFAEPHYFYWLGPAIKPDHEVKTGKIWRSGGVSAALELLLTCDTISEARDRTDERLNAAGA
jgi:hypothetical protein